MVEGMTVKEFFKWGVYEGAKLEDKETLRKKIIKLRWDTKFETYEEMMQGRWTLEVLLGLLTGKIWEYQRGVLKPLMEVA